MTGTYNAPVMDDKGRGRGDEQQRVREWALPKGREVGGPAIPNTYPQLFAVGMMFRACIRDRAEIVEGDIEMAVVAERLVV